MRIMDCGMSGHDIESVLVDGDSRSVDVDGAGVGDCRGVHDYGSENLVAVDGVGIGGEAYCQWLAVAERAEEMSDMAEALNEDRPGMDIAVDEGDGVIIEREAQV